MPSIGAYYGAAIAITIDRMDFLRYFYIKGKFLRRNLFIYIRALMNE